MPTVSYLKHTIGNRLAVPAEGNQLSRSRPQEPPRKWLREVLARSK
jgi:hypothetical protein